MKHSTRIAQKLALRKETIRQLDRLALEDVDGGLPTTFTQLSRVDCHTRRICVTTPAP